MSTKIEQMKLALRKAKNVIQEFKKERDRFDETITKYNEFRNNKFNQEIKQKYIEFKDKIKQSEKEIITLKSQKEDLDNLFFLDEKGFNQLCEFFRKDIPEGTDIPNHNRTDYRGMNYGFKDLLENATNIEKSKKRLTPLYEMAKKNKLDWKTVVEERNKCQESIEDKNSEILQLKQQKDDLKKQSNPYPNANFGYKIVHSEKVDTDKYIEIINKNMNYISELDNSIDFEYFESYQYSLLTDIVKKCDKIRARFERVKEFMENYSVLLLSIEKRTKQYGQHLESPEFIDKIVKQIKILEQKEMTTSLKDKQDLAKQLGISEFNRNKTQQDVIEVVDTVAKIKVAALTTPNSAFDKGVYWLKTPFEQVRVEAHAYGNLMIYPKSKRVAPTYDVISLKLDGALDGKDKNDFIKKVIDPMINYLKQTIPIPTDDLKNQNLLNEVKSTKPDEGERNFLTDEQKEAAATLCGILMLSESHQFRNPTLGKFERSSVKRVKQLIQKGITNPFSVVYANKSGEYINAHDKTSDSNSDSNMSDGGHKQTRQLLRYKVFGEDMAINISDLPDWIKGGRMKTSMLDQSKRLDANGYNNTNGDYIKIKDLDNNKKYVFFKGDKKQTIKEFVEKQLSRNMKDQYKN